MAASGFAQSKIAGAERHLDVLTQAEACEAIVVGFAGFVIDHAQHALMGCGQFAEDAERAVSKWDGLRADGGEKLIVREAARLIEDGRVEIRRAVMAPRSQAS